MNYSPDPGLRFHGVVGAVAAFSTSLEKIFLQKLRPSLSIILTQNRHTSGGWEMTTDDVVVDVSQDWVLACDVQRRFNNEVRQEILSQITKEFAKGWLDLCRLG